jgi:hypothetical protein
LAGVGSRLRSHVNEDPGTHNFERENREQFYKMLGDFFYAGEDSFDAKEIESQNEVKSAEELNVPLRANNLDFNLLARQLMADLPRRNASTKPTAESVGRVVRLSNYRPTAEKIDESTEGETKATYWRIRVGDDWAVPLVELCRGTPESVVCVMADGGRAGAMKQIETLLADKYRVLAIDPFYLGESKLDDRGYLFALLVSSVGARPIGVQVDQLQAVTRWATEHFGHEVEKHVAIGPRISLAALVAAATATDHERPQQLVLHESLSSLREIVEKSWSVNDFPEMFCFGLLEHCDIDDLIELAKPCKVLRK